MNHSKRRFSRGILALAAGLSLSLGSLAQSFPSKPVTLLVPYPAGGLSDVVARLIATPTSKALGQPVVVENLSGATGSIAAQKVLSSPADGYMVFMGSPNELILSPLANAAVKFKSEDFRLVQLNTLANMAILTRKDLPANTADELVEYARKTAREGKPLTYASVGVGSFYHLLGEHLSKTIQAPMLHVPYKGAAPANIDLVGGQVDIFISPFGKIYEDYQKQGKIKVLAMLNSTRQDAVKDYPAIGESKSLANFTFNIWGGFFVRKDTPEPVVQVLHKAISTAMADPALRTAMEAQSMIIPPLRPLDAMGKIYTDEIAVSRAIAKSINLQPQ